MGQSLLKFKMKKVSLILSLVITTAMMVNSCGGGKTEEGASTEVTIGKQVWMTQNLNVDMFRNGDPIPEAKTAEEWIRAGENGQPAWSYYNNNPDNGDRHGKLYNWYAVNDSRGLAPEGWKIPSDEDWSRLEDFLGGMYLEVGVKMKSIDFWAYYLDYGGTNESGFSGLPGGRRRSDGRFDRVGSEGYWWSSTEDDTSSAWCRYLSYGSKSVWRYGFDKDYGFSVRCLRD
jgi:uncharacterized protein (TIGR02145 family)